MQIIERVEGRYEIQDVEFGRVYRWCPECVIIDCDCGEKPILTASMSTCGGCGVDHATVIREELSGGEQPGGKTLSPWRYAGDGEGSGLPY